MKRAFAAIAIIAAVGGTATAVSADHGGDGSATGRPLATTLTPDQEVGDFRGVEGASGQVSLRLNPGRQLVCVDLVVDGFEPVLAHIHEGPAGVNGPVVVGFDALVDGNTATGCVQASRSQIVDILIDPANYYVNVHAGAPGTPGFFEGVRGQLDR